MSIDSQLENLRISFQALEDAKKLQGKMADELIAELPEDMRGQAVQLINKARKGYVDTAELMKFASNVRDIDKEKFQKSVEEAVERVNQKEREATKE